MLDMNLVSQRLLQARLDAKLSQYAVARELRCTRQAVGSWEHGVLPSERNLAAVCALYRCDPEYILHGPRQQPPELKNDRQPPAAAVAASSSSEERILALIFGPQGVPDPYAGLRPA